jgi:hypothetical protein
MSQVSISEASRLTSKTRKTIYKYINDGMLTVSIDTQGKKVIDISELIRVFGEIEMPEYTEVNNTEISNNIHQVTLENIQLIAEKDVEIARLQSLLSGKDELLNAKNEQIKTLEKSLHLLEDLTNKIPTPTIQKPVKNGFWKRLLGK